MKGKSEITDPSMGKLSLNLAIVGAGRTAKFFLELFRNMPFSYVDVNLVGVCDINPEAEGMLMAKEKGIYTTDNFMDLFKIKNLDAVVELTNSRKVLLELIQRKPKGVGVLEHNVGKLLKGLSSVDQRLKSAELQVDLEKGISDFLIKQTNERIVMLNPDFTIVEANEPYLNAVGKSRENVIGAPCYEVTHGLNAPCATSQPELGCPLVETLRSGESAHVIHEHPAPDDQAIYCNMVTYPLKDKDGEILRVMEIWQDITKELSSRWQNRIDALKDDFKALIQEDRMVSLGKLVASSVHEINNPIQGLLTYANLMKSIVEQDEPSRKDLEDFQNYLSTMSDELERCGNIVSGLLSFSRQSDMAHEELDLNRKLQQVITLIQHKMEIQEIQVTVKLHTTPLIITGDANQLQQCFLNLIFNAIEAMPKGGHLYIRSSKDKSRDTALIEVRDTGCGIADDNLSHIFDPFFTTKKEGEGTGMGLSIVYGITKNHGGDIKVESQVGKGSSFVLKFPLRSPSA